MCGGFRFLDLKYSMVNISRTVVMLALLTGVLSLFTGCNGGGRNNTGFDVDPEYAMLAVDEAQQKELRALALDYLVKMTEDDYAGYRANAIEALGQEEPVIGQEAARVGLMDDNAGVRFTSAMIIGQKRYSSSAPLVHALINDPDDSVKAAAIFALRVNGYAVDISPLAEMLNSSSARTRANAALVLGELGDVSAIPLLRAALNINLPRTELAEMRIFQLQIAEALVKLGDESSVARIRAPLYTRDPSDGEIAAFAASIIGRIGDQSSKHDLIKTVAMWKQYRNSAEIRLAAMASLAQLGDPPGIDMVTEYLGADYQNSEDIRMRSIQAQAIFTLGQIGTPEVLPIIGQIFAQDTDDLLRIPAATAILNIVKP